MKSDVDDKAPPLMPKSFRAETERVRFLPVLINISHKYDLNSSKPDHIFIFPSFSNNSAKKRH